LQRVRRQWVIGRGECCSADIFVLELKLMAECIGNGLQNKDSLCSDFGADAVARENGEIQEHAGISLMEGVSRCTII
jgi:hypothetical protein